ncbi:hypothetical protein D3C72_1809060 [compost metagenome]
MKVQPLRQTDDTLQFKTADVDLADLARHAADCAQNIFLFQIVEGRREEPVPPVGLILDAGFPLLALGRLVGITGYRAGTGNRFEGGRIADIGRNPAIEEIADAGAARQFVVILVERPRDAGQAIARGAGRRRPILPQPQCRTPAIINQLVLHVEAGLRKVAVHPRIERR